MKFLSLDEVSSNLAAIGIPAVILLAIISISPFAGAAAITSALVIIGPLGMVGGIVTLISIGALAGAISRYGIKAILIASVNKYKAQGYKDEDIIERVNKAPISRTLKDSILSHLNELNLINYERKQKEKKKKKHSLRPFITDYFLRKIYSK